MSLKENICKCGPYKFSPNDDLHPHHHGTAKDCALGLKVIEVPPNSVLRIVRSASGIKKNLWQERKKADSNEKKREMEERKIAEMLEKQRIKIENSLEKGRFPAAIEKKLEEINHLEGVREVT